MDQQYAPSAPPLNEQSFDVVRLQRFKQICAEHEINDEFANRLRNLEGYQIIIVADDSGSMNEMLREPLGSNGQQQSRWDELKKTVKIIVDIAAVLDRDGIDVHFLNRGSYTNVMHQGHLETPFSTRAAGSTPILKILDPIFAQHGEQKRLIIIATDGVPDTHRGRDGPSALRHALEYERGPNDHVTIIACTDDDDTMEYLDGWDKQIPRLDVVDDYASEKAQIKRIQGSKFLFSFGDYVAKAMMGPIDLWFDQLDEVKITPSEASYHNTTYPTTVDMPGYVNATHVQPSYIEPTNVPRDIDPPPMPKANAMPIKKKKRNKTCVIS